MCRDTRESTSGRRSLANPESIPVVKKEASTASGYTSGTTEHDTTSLQVGRRGIDHGIDVGRAQPDRNPPGARPDLTLERLEAVLATARRRLAPG